MFFISIIGFLIYFITNSSSLDDLEALSTSPVMIYLQMIAFTIAVILMYVFFERKRNWPLGLKQAGAAGWLLRGLIAGIILMSVAASLIWLLGGIDWKWIGFNDTVVSSLLSGLVLFIGVAVYEELVSRGYVQGLIKFHYGRNAAIAVSSLLFAFMHGMNPGTFDSPFPFINLLLAGVLLAVSREASGGLWMPIGIHLTWNYFQGYIFGFKVSGTETVPAVLETALTGSDVLSGGSFGVEGSFITTIILILGIMAVRYMYGTSKSSY